MKELIGVCKECKYKCGRVENPLFTGVKECEYATVEQIHKDIRRRDVRAGAQDAARIPHQRLDNTLERESAGAEDAGNIPAPHCKIRQENQCNDRQVSACTPRRLEGKQQAHHAHPDVRGIQASGSGKRVLTPEDIAIAGNCRSDIEPIPQRQILSPAPLPLECRIERNRQRQQKHDMRRAHLDRAQRAERIDPDLENSPDDQHRCECLVQQSCQNARTAFSVLILHELLRSGVQFAGHAGFSLFFFHRFPSGSVLCVSSPAGCA